MVKKGAAAVVEEEEPPKTQVFASLKHFVTEATWDQKYSWCLDTINSLINRENTQTDMYKMILGPSKTHDVETGTSSSSSRPVQIVCDQKPPATAGRGRRAAATTRKKKGEKDAPEGDGSVARRPKTRRKKKNVVPEDDPRGSGSESRQPLPGQPRRRRMPAQQQHPPEYLFKLLYFFIFKVLC